jgi:transcriptional regulator GlxA family with amidase domain
MSQSTPAEADVFHVGVVLTPGFSLMAFASTVEPLRGANLISGQILYRWTYLSPEGGTARSGGGLEVITAPLPGAAEADFDMVVVCGGMGCETYRSRPLHAFLRRVIRRNVIVGSVSTASFVLASGGLLDNRRCTVHWDYLESFREAFPQVEATADLFVIDHGIFTCAGGTAAMDVMLHFIRERHGDAFAGAVSDQFIYGTMRQPRDAQRMAVRSRLGISDPVIIGAIEQMEGAVETPVRLPLLARKVGVSTRQLERLFRRHLGCSPAQHYIRIRLERARGLLRQTTLSVMEVGLACGFTSASHFARTYRAHFRIVPSADRTPEIASFNRALPEPAPAMETG